MEARIHSFESFGTVDGPGIRFVIFMQGCSLKCKYCHNRDTWDLCGGTQYTLEEVLEKIEKYKNYFMPSGGGVTVSGGEPLLQLEFVTELFTILKKENIHTAIDTSGNFIITEDIKKLIDLTDLFLLDIKCINDEICKSLTGVSNKQELAFARYLSSIKKDMWIRQVIVPGITDKEDDLLKLREFINSLDSIRNVEFLPYHDMGRYKWENLGLKYPLDGVRTANIDDVKRARKLVLE